MHAPLVGEGGVAHVGGAPVRGLVGALVDKVGELTQPLQVRRCLQLGPVLEHQGGDEARQVGVADALAVTPLGALQVARPGPQGCQRVGHGQVGVVVGVDADGGPRKGLHDALRGGMDLLGQPPAVGIGEDQRVGAARGRRLEGGERVRRVVGVAVEEMLGVVDHAPPRRAQEGHRLADHRQVLFQAHLQRLANVQPPRLAEDHHHRRLGGHEGLQRRILLYGTALATGGAEGRQARSPRQLAPLHGFEELGVARVRTRPTALDQVDPEAGQGLGDGQLVADGEADPLTLGTVAQGGVQQLDPRPRQLATIHNRCAPPSARAAPAPA